LKKSPEPISRFARTLQRQKIQSSWDQALRQGGSLWTPPLKRSGRRISLSKPAVLDCFWPAAGPRGTLHAVSRFLELQCGVRWWTPWASRVKPWTKVTLLNESGLTPEKWMEKIENAGR
jgi:hypothetical protein